MKTSFNGHRLVNPLLANIVYLSGHGGPDMWVEIQQRRYPLSPDSAATRLEELWQPRVVNVRSLVQAHGSEFGFLDLCRKYCRSCPGSSYHNNDLERMPGDVQTWPHLLIPVGMFVGCKHRRGTESVLVCERHIPDKERISECNTLIPTLRSDIGSEGAWLQAERLERVLRDLLRPVVTELTPAAREADARDAASAEDNANAHIAAAARLLQ